jgi:hypothetical protein
LFKASHDFYDYCRDFPNGVMPSMGDGEYSLAGFSGVVAGFWTAEVDRAETNPARFNTEGRNLIADSTSGLIMLVRAAVRGDNVDPHQLCPAAIAVMDNPPADEVLAALLDHVCQTAMDWAEFDGSRQKLGGGVLAYIMR